MTHNCKDKNMMGLLIQIKKVTRAECSVIQRPVKFTVVPTPQEKACVYVCVHVWGGAGGVRGHS